MTPKEYQKLALRTEPTEEQYKVVADRLQNEDLLKNLKENFAIAAMNLRGLDKLKKHIFYGKDAQLWATPECSVPDGMKEKITNLKTIRLLHAVIGLATEAGELIEMLESHLCKGGELDLVNGGEEFGDSQWYTAIGLDVCNMSFEHIMTRNIEKLAARYGDKFSDFKALNRDLDTERKILEK